MRTLVIIALVLAATSAEAAKRERVVTCDGPYRGERVGYCHLWDHLFNDLFGTDVPEPVGVDKVGKACEMYRRCVVRARVIPRGIVDGYQNYTVLRVYSARRGK